ncbi:MAG: tRNA 2-thiouridine(34) synthase MnmA [Lachnospiraceae bacterium]|nr:tRNA 2-thiouridine(34) synthase MnmA [Lachnospiraceae bacterium]
MFFDENRPKTALIAMSGGVDSSVAAYLMQDAGFDCIGCTMKLHDAQNGVDESHSCCSTQDIEDAKKICDRLSIPHYLYNFMDGFREEIIEKFIRSYERGETPNPCIDCNRCMKFHQLYLRAKELGCEYIVTGHYARVGMRDGEYVLMKGLDPSKDQSYVLFNLSQENLAHTIFPLGELPKSVTRDIATKQGFVNANKPDSQDICFVPDGDYAALIERETKKIYPTGNFVDASGKVLGQHRGIIHYTIGQRKGLGIAAKHPLFVYELDVKENVVYVGEGSELFRRDCHVEKFHWISDHPSKDPFRCSAKIRYRHEDQPALCTPREDGSVDLYFDEPQRAITPGQYAVLYDGEIVLGGGTIRM